MNLGLRKNSPYLRALVSIGVAALFAMGLLSASSAGRVSSSGIEERRVIAERQLKGPRRDGESPVRWKVLKVLGKRKIRIGRYIGWCPGPDSENLNPTPKIQRVRQVERRRRVIITAFLVHRAQKNCAGVETLVSYVVTLRHKLGRRSLYDGSVSPPAKRWPRQQANSNTSAADSRLGRSCTVVVKASHQGDRRAFARMHCDGSEPEVGFEFLIGRSGKSRPAGNTIVKRFWRHTKAKVPGSVQRGVCARRERQAPIVVLSCGARVETGAVFTIGIRFSKSAFCKVPVTVGQYPNDPDVDPEAPPLPNIYSVVRYRGLPRGC